MFKKIKDKEDFRILLADILKEINEIENDAKDVDEWSVWYRNMLTFKYSAMNTKLN